MQHPSNIRWQAEHQVCTAWCLLQETCSQQRQHCICMGRQPIAPQSSCCLQEILGSWDECASSPWDNWVLTPHSMTQAPLDERPSQYTGCDLVAARAHVSLCMQAGQVLPCAVFVIIVMSSGRREGQTECRRPPWPSFQGSSVDVEVTGVWQRLISWWLGRYDTVHWHWLAPRYH